MKIAVPAKGKALTDNLDPRFGRAPYFLIVDPDTMKFDVIEGNSKMHGAGIHSAKAIADSGAKVVIAGMVGPKAFQVLKVVNIDVYVGAGGRVAGVIAQYKRGELQPAGSANCQGGLGGRA